jgi:crotonobetainyl-CoA:carnitine CoA-transferase CaiB-like acyl-CoA transferase
MREQKSSFDFGKYSANQIRLENKGIINHAIQSEFVKLDSHKLINLLHSKGIPAGPVNTMLDVIDDQTNFEYKLLQKVIIPNVGEVIVSTGGINFTNQPSIPYQLAPTLNQHE